MSKRLTPAAGYVRCSTEMQEDSPDQQKKEISAFAERTGYEIREWYVDFGKSGTTFDQRPEFLRLWSTVEAGADFKAVICYDESRWGRAIDAEENTFWRVRFRKHGVEVLLVKTSIDPGHEYAPMLKAFEGVQASQYSKKLSELTLRGAMSNGRFSSGGPAPYGYRRMAVNQKTGAERLLADGEWCTAGQEKVFWVLGEEAEVNIVRLIFALRITGAGYGPIAERLNGENVPCPARGRWRNKDQKWSTITVKSIINNPAYYGARVYNRNSMSKIRAKQEGWDERRDASYPHWKQDPDKWVVVEDAHEAIVSKEIWLKANPVTDRSKIVRSKLKAPYLLSNLIICSKCGFHFQGQTTGAKGRSYPRYICGGFNSKGVCDFVAIRRDPLETFVAACIRETLNRPDFLERARGHLERILAVGSAPGASSTAHLERSIEDVDRRMANIAKAIEEGEEIGLFRPRLAELRTERARLEELRKVSLTKVVKGEQIDGLIEEIAAVKERFLSSFEEAPLHEKKQMIQTLVDRIEVQHTPTRVDLFVRQVPCVDREVEKRLQEGRINEQAVRVSGPPVVNVLVAGAGLEPATFGL